MGDNLVWQIVQLLRYVLENNIWVVTGMVSFGVLGMFGATPLDVEKIREPDSWDYLMTRVRRLAVFAVVMFVLPLPGFTSYLYCVQFGVADPGGCSAFGSFRNGLYLRGGISMLSAAAIAWLIGFVWSRTVWTWWSHWSRKLRFKVSDEELPDIRNLAGKLRMKAYDPRKHYDRRRSDMFVGLNQDGKRVLLSEKDWEGRHMEVIGPTGFGKGVVVGALIDQLIRMNARSDRKHVVIAIMPKQDVWLPHIMSQAAQSVGSKFRFFDMNSRHKGGGWAPLSVGTSEERRTRLMTMLGMGATGSDADFYKLGEKKVLDVIMDSKEHSCLVKLKNELEEAGKKKGATAAVRAIDTLNEICRMDTFTAPPEKAGLNVERLLTSDQPEILYVNSSLTHETVLNMTKALLLEITQQAMSLQVQGKRKTHIWLFVDELRFLVSESFDKALATCGMYNMNIIAAYQSATDLEKVSDKNLNGRAIQHSVHTNMQLKLVYRVGEGDQAKWAAELTGTKWLSITGREEAEADRFGAEKWTASRSVQKTEGYYFSENELKALPKRCGILIAPERLAQMVFTAHVPVEQIEDFYSQRPRQEKRKESEEERNASTDQVEGSGINGAKRALEGEKQQERKVRLMTRADIQKMDMEAAMQKSQAVVIQGGLDEMVDVTQKTKANGSSGSPALAKGESKEKDRKGGEPKAAEGESSEEIDAQEIDKKYQNKVDDAETDIFGAGAESATPEVAKKEVDRAANGNEAPGGKRAVASVQNVSGKKSEPGRPGKGRRANRRHGHRPSSVRLVE